VQIVHGGRTAIDPGNDVISFNQVSRQGAMAMDASAILTKPGGGNFGRREPSSLVSLHEH
jgi:hypothetical protein